jgi:hypothetical protein
MVYPNSDKPFGINFTGILLNLSLSNFIFKNEYILDIFLFN